MTARSNQLRVLAFALPAPVAVVCLLAFAGPAANATGPAGNENIQIPLRWCALQGSPAADLRDRTNSILLRRQFWASQIWRRGGNITIRSPFPAGVPASSANFPVIGDPWPPAPYRADGLSGGPGKLGDILEPQDGDEESFAEYKLARAECEEEWDRKALNLGVSIKGTIALNIRKFVVPPGTISLTETQGRGEFPTSFSATPGGTLPDPRCETPPDRVTAVGETFMGVKDFRFVSGPRAKGRDAGLVAHELGHTLYLGHGNGLDDNGDIKYDTFCDPPPGESPFRPPPTLMTQADESTTVTTLQRGTSRAIARVTPGSQIDPPFEPIAA